MTSPGSHSWEVVGLGLELGSVPAQGPMLLTRMQRGTEWRALGWEPDLALPPQASVSPPALCSLVGGPSSSDSGGCGRLSPAPASCRPSPGPGRQAVWGSGARAVTGRSPGCFALLSGSSNTDSCLAWPQSSRRHCHVSCFHGAGKGQPWVGGQDLNPVLGGLLAVGTLATPCSPVNTCGESEPEKAARA